MQATADHSRLNEEHKKVCEALSGVVSEILPSNATQTGRIPVGTTINSRE